MNKVRISKVPVHKKLTFNWVGLLVRRSWCTFYDPQYWTHKEGPRGFRARSIGIGYRPAQPARPILISCLL